jgi:2-(1,2-epoxy-1,2-dihydrophenyl)acetyl-CoA isomerase
MNARSAPYQTLTVSRDGRIATITLNQPSKLNAFTPQQVEELGVAFDEVGADDAVGAVILTGAGRSFSAGGDVRLDVDLLRRLSKPEFQAYLGQAKQMFKAIFYCPKPTIAAVHGYAVGAGLEVALCCDARIAATDAKFGEFFVKMGLTPEVGMYLLPKIVGLGRARLLQYTGDLVEASEAYRIGLVDEVVPQEQLIPTAEALAKRLAEGPKAIRIIKRGINDSLDMSFEDALEHMIELDYEAVHTKDHEEAVTAWLERRKPVFKGI